jgi:hypothetical protein
MKKKLLLFSVLFCMNAISTAQPTVLYTSLATQNPSPSNSRFVLNDFGVFRQTRFQANESVSSGARTWAFHLGSPSAADYSKVWRPYSANNTLSKNNYIPTSFANGARYNTGGGSDGLLPDITSGKYYTFNVFERGDASSEMMLLETNYNPVSLVSRIETINNFNLNIAINTSATPSSGEFLYLRYSSNGWASSVVLPIDFSGSTIGNVKIPLCTTTVGSVSYYIFSSNFNSSDLNNLVIANGQTAYDLATLSLLNAGSNNNFSYNFTVSTSVWNGSSWNPALTGHDIIDFQSNFNSTADIAACSCVVTSGNVVINHTLNVLNNVAVNGGSLTFENNSSLIQENNSPSNTGNIIYKRVATVGNASDYVYWSSPVTGSQTLASLYPFSTNFYGWSAASGGTNGAVTGNWSSASGIMGLGAGYIVRSAATGSYTTVFNGVPNNGNVAINISRGSNTTASTLGTNGRIITNLDDNWNLIGNPYPSAVKATDFITANASNLSSGTIWLWSHNTPLSTGASQSFYDATSIYNYNSNDYIAYNQAGASSGAGTFSGYIAAGQSFFINMIDGSSASGVLSFTNAMRKNSSTNNGYDNSNFYRNTNQNIQRNRVWLDFKSIHSNQISRTMIGYIEGATQNFDFDFDAPTNYENPQNFYSLIGNQAFSIQSKGLPFDQNDTIPLGFVAATAGNHSIGIGTVDSFFLPSNQNIYLEDLQTRTIHNLTIAPYYFETVAGSINDRFILKYTNQALSTSLDLYENSIIIAKNSEGIKIKSSIENISKIEIYDLLGRVVFEENEINKNEFSYHDFIDNIKTNIVKVILSNGFVLTKKIIY